MKVYIILDESNGLGFGCFVDKVFSDKEKAIDYVYALYIKNTYYAKKSKQDLMKEIESCIHEAEIE